MNDNKREDRYIQFPLCLVQGTYQNPNNGFNIILDYGVVNYAKSFKFDIKEVARQLMYAYYRNRKMIQDDLYNAFCKYLDNGALTTDEDYNGFAGASFYPDDSITELLTLFESNPKFKESAIFRYQIVQAESSLKLKDYDIDSTIKNYNKGLSIKNNFERVHGPDCCPSVKPSQVIEFRDSGKDLDLFRASIGIKSMLGRRNFISTNKPAILSRMIGCKSKSAFEYFTADKYNKDKNLLPTVEKFSKRYHMDKLLLTLAERKYIMFLSKKDISVLYVSKYMEPEQLVALIMKTKEQQNLKRKIKQASLSLTF